jgi:hypothetical protein
MLLAIGQAMARGSNGDLLSSSEAESNGFIVHLHRHAFESGLNTFAFSAPLSANLHNCTSNGLQSVRGTWLWPVVPVSPRNAIASLNSSSESTDFWNDSGFGAAAIAISNGRKKWFIIQLNDLIIN